MDVFRKTMGKFTCCVGWKCKCGGFVKSRNPRVQRQNKQRLRRYARRKLKQELKMPSQLSWLEHLSYKEEVAGSSPAGDTVCHRSASTSTWLYHSFRGRTGSLPTYGWSSGVGWGIRPMICIIWFIVSIPIVLVGMKGANICQICVMQVFLGCFGEAISRKVPSPSNGIAVVFLSQ